MSHITRYAPSTQQISVDEAYLNMTGTSRLLGSPADVAARMKSEILSKFGLVVSIGVGPSRFIAKMASDFDKPDGLHVVVPGGESDFVLGLDLKDLWGLGKKTQMRLEALAIRTVSDLRGYPIEFLCGHFGPSLGAYLFKACRGIDPGVYKETPSTYSVSTETTFEQDIDEIDTLEAILLELCENVMFRAFHEGITASTATLKLRRHDFQTRSRQRTIGHSIASVDELFQLTRTLLNETWDQTPIRLVGIGLSTRGEECTGQTELFDSDSVDIRRKRAEQAVWSARDRLGVSITKARSMKDPEQKRSG